jgi:hypothetical protein
MRIRLTRNTFVEGQSLSCGDEVEVKDVVGRQLLAIHKAVEIEDPHADPHPGLHPAASRPAVQERTREGEGNKIVVDASDGVSDEELSEAARVLREARETTLAATRETGLPKKTSTKPKRKG